MTRILSASEESRDMAPLRQKVVNTGRREGGRNKKAVKEWSTIFHRFFQSPLQQLFDFRSHSFRCLGGFEACCHISFSVDEEFSEVPFNGVVVQEMGIVLFDEVQEDLCIGMVHVQALEALFLCEVLEEGLGIIAAYIAFTEHGEGDAIVQAAEFLDFSVACRILFCKLVAWEAQHHEAPVFIGIVQLFQSFKLGREAAFAGGIHNEKDLALVVGQGNFLSLSIDCFEIVNVHTKPPGAFPHMAAAPPVESLFMVKRYLSI